MVKSQNGLKGTKPVGVLEEISKIYQNLQGRALAGDPFIVKFQPVIAYKYYLVNFIKKETPTRIDSQALPVSFGKNY